MAVEKSGTVLSGGEKGMGSALIDMSDIALENKVIGFSGSPRKNGNSDWVLRQIVSGVQDEALPADWWNLTDVQFSGCIGCEQCRKSKVCTGLMDGMTLLYPELKAAKGLVLVSPTHNYNITAWMKAFIDRLYCFYNFEKDHPRSWSSQLSHQNRKAVVVAICEQESVEDMGFTLEAMNRPLKALGYEIVGELAVFSVFDKAKVREQEQVMHEAYALGQKLAGSLIGTR
jgi:multimeric flavodoxin WrbA